MGCFTTLSSNPLGCFTTGRVLPRDWPRPIVPLPRRSSTAQRRAAGKAHDVTMQPSAGISAAVVCRDRPGRLGDQQTNGPLASPAARADFEFETACATADFAPPTTCLQANRRMSWSALVVKCLKFWHSACVSARSEFNLWWSIGDSNPGPPLPARRAHTVSIRLRMVLLRSNRSCRLA